ncbi:mannitol dehydrogenase family protein [Piscinibacter sakaiensis]|uniref:mannitol dehydrogenase family protein n=1 Tax=Piscinibacter sakaiensis TaxID=1547922 RepID=UPI003AAD5EBC
MLKPGSNAILQFGTSRFLQAHVDLFVSQALENGDAGKALGGITVVQTTADADRARRIAAMAGGDGYPVRIRGISDGQLIDRTMTCRSVRRALQADADWPQLLAIAGSEAQVMISNTADRGFQLDAIDGPSLIGSTQQVPRSFPAKLLVLLNHRWQVNPGAALSIFPCELIERNGDALRKLVVDLAGNWCLPDDFLDWLSDHCVWANSLVDRIVSESIEPVGAVAEPYALWAIERQAGLVLPCLHKSIVLTDDLAHYARLKLFLLNAGHTFLAELWLRDGGPADQTVAQAMSEPGLRDELEALWAEEIVPLFDAMGQGDAARSYLVELRERLMNPFLAHRIGDIAGNHEQKKQRRLAPLLALAAQQNLPLPQRRLRAALAAPHCSLPTVS